MERQKSLMRQDRSRLFFIFLSFLSHGTQKKRLSI